MPLKGLKAIGLIVFVLSMGACETSDSTPVASPALLSTGADIVIIGMEHIVTVDGVREGQVVADTAFIYNDSSEYVLKNPTLELYDEEGRRKARVTAEQGRMNMQTQEMLAQGNVVLTISDGNKRVESQELNYDPNGDRIWSDSLTVMREQGTVSQGMGFTSDLDFRYATVGPGSIRNTGGGGGRDPGNGGGRNRP